jgi:hypothetical protein
MGKDDNDPPRRSQPLIDVLKTVKALEQSPLWREQQAASAKLREKLALPPDLDEALREVRAEAARLDIEAMAKATAKEDVPAEAAVEPANSPAPTTEPTSEPANEPAAESTSEPAAEPATATESTNSPANEAANEGAAETADDQHQQSSMGAPRINWPHLEEALQACGEKFPKATRSDTKQMKFVADFLRAKGDVVAYERTEAGEKTETQKRTIHRRINEWHARRSQFGS